MTRFIAGTTGNFWHAARPETYDDGVARSLCGRTIFVDHHADFTTVNGSISDAVEAIVEVRENVDGRGQIIECLSCLTIARKERSR